MGDDDTEHFSLRWNNFHNNLTDGFHALLQGEDFVDVTLAAGGKFVQAHKLVLSVCSPYFKELFKVNPCKHPIVILKDVSYKDLVSILHFMYKGEANVRQEELSPFLKTAETLQIKGLTGDDSSQNEDNDTQSRVASPPTVKTNDRPYKRHSASTVHRPHVPPSPPPARKRAKVEPAVPVVPVPTPVMPPARERSTEFVAVTLPKSEPVDYEPDIEVLDVKNDPLVHLLQGETSHHSHHDDTDSHQSHFDASDTNLDSSQSLLEDSQSHMDPSQSLLDTSQGSSGMFAGIAGLSHSQDGASQDGSQGSQDDNRNLSEHLNYSCTFCGKTFSWQKSMLSHIRNTHGEDKGPFSCTICGNILKNMRVLRVHMKIRHKTEIVFTRP